MKPQNHHTLPDGWEMKRLGEVIAELESGSSLNSFDRKIQHGEIGILKVSAVSGCKFTPSEHKTILPKESHLARINPRKDSIIISRSNTPELVGHSAYIHQDHPNLYLPDKLWQTVLRKGAEVNSMWLSQSLASEEMLRRISTIATGSSNSMKNISKEKFLKFEICFPPLAEQKQIAAVLGTWDRAIEQSAELLKTLRIRHRGLMYRLLTGQVRLPGYVGEWRHIEINEIAREVSIRNRHDLPLKVLSCTKYDGLVDSLSYFGRKIYSDDLTTYKIVSKGQFAYATNHIEEGSIGYQSRYEAALISPMYTVFSTDSSVEDTYLYYLLKTDRYIQEYRRNMVGSIDRRGGLRWGDFSKIVVSLPTVDEQRAIANVLDASLREIRQHEAKLEALREQKRGLMQCLLTGQVRVPTEATA
ncbi:restriction endonuclease subunit S [Fibrella aquatica]|uniref:restriction endonuclease subunit S n=1 Tax=Fibrella aquatica TaxID=3242487 RepID=UPI0035228985